MSASIVTFYALASSNLKESMVRRSLWIFFLLASVTAIPSQVGVSQDVPCFGNAEASSLQSGSANGTYDFTPHLNLCLPVHELPRSLDETCSVLPEDFGLGRQTRSLEIARSNA